MTAGGRRERRPSPPGASSASGSKAWLRHTQFSRDAVAGLTEAQRGEPGAPILVDVLVVNEPGTIQHNGIAKAMQMRENGQQRLILPMIGAVRAARRDALLDQRAVPP